MVNHGGLDGKLTALRQYQFIIGCVVFAGIDELSVAEELLEKKYEGFADMDNKELSRVYGYLQRRGFSYGVIKEAVADLAEKGI